MRNIERLLTGTCLGGSMLAGALHAPEWLLVTPLCFLGLAFAEDRLVRHRMGDRAWPSAGYARFVFGTNLYVTLRNTVLSAAVFAIAATATSLVGG